MNIKDLRLLQRAPRLDEAAFSKLPREEQEEYLALLKAEVTLKMSNKLLTFKPMQKQMQFMISDAICRAIFGGNRSGKTTVGGIEFCSHITKTYPDWYPESMRLTGPVKGRIIATDFQKGIGEVIIPFLDEWLDPALIAKKIRNNMGIPVKYLLKDGSQFDLLTHEQDINQFEGWKGHIAWFDEPPPRDRYVATQRGLVDYNGRHWLTLTPLTQPWIYDDIYTKADGKSIFVVTCDIRENTHLDEGAIKEFESKLTEEEKSARLHGKFLHLSGLVYKEFEPDIHIVEPFQIPKNWTRYMAIDPHERTPTAVLWLAVDEKENHWIYDELWLSDMDVEQISLAIHAQEGDTSGQRPVIRLIDPHSDKDNQLVGGFNFRKELMRHGVFCQKGNSDTLLGKSKIRQALTPRYSFMLKRNIPTLRVFRTCTQTIWEFQHYSWDEYRRNKEEYNPKEEVKKKFDHFMDALRYIYNYGPRYIAPDDESDSTTIKYEGDYAKRQVLVETDRYHDLVEQRGKRGNF